MPEPESLFIFPAASMGACEGKAVGQWFGPNTIAQVLRCATLIIFPPNQVFTVVYDI